MHEVYDCCGKCGKEIRFGGAVVSIVRNIEQRDYDVAEKMGVITIIDSEDIISLCPECGSSFNTKALSNIVKALPPFSKRNCN